MGHFASRLAPLLLIRSEPSGMAPCISWTLSKVCELLLQLQHVAQLYGKGSLWLNLTRNQVQLNLIPRPGMPWAK